MSQTLSQTHLDMSADGVHLNDDSKVSENTLEEAIKIIYEYADDKVTLLNGTLTHKSKMSLYDCQRMYHQYGGPEPNEENKRYSLKPDGGILIATFLGVEYPILIMEDKLQGTNDRRLYEGKKKQSLGNAIERAGKNIRGAEMIFSGLSVFPYLLFTSGCDFHSCETISKRIEMMNFGYPNHYINITSETNEEDVDSKINEILETLDISKKSDGKCVAPAFIKAHKWDEMEHGASMWTRDEYVKIACHVIDMVLESIN